MTRTLLDFHSTLKVGLIMALTQFCGCSYLETRGQDLVDVVTASIETSAAGEDLQFGPFPVGFVYGDGRGYGLRSGVRGRYDHETIHVLLAGKKTLETKTGIKNKDYEVRSVYARLLMVAAIYGVAFKSGQSLPEFEIGEVIGYEGAWTSYFNFEFAAGVGVLIRVGGNVAELAAFLLGFAPHCSSGLKTLASSITEFSSRLDSRQAADAGEHREPG